MEEIAQLRVVDCAASAFTVHKGKTPAARRSVPIHPELAELVKRRSDGKADTAFLFEELGEGAPKARGGGYASPAKRGTGKAAAVMPRSAAVSKRFGRFIRRIDVAEVVKGKRRSLVNFHSFRRWFTTKAEQAGQPVHVIEAVMGHKRQGMTLGRYSGGPSEEQRRAVVEAVRLPAGAV